MNFTNVCFNFFFLYFNILFFISINTDMIHWPSPMVASKRLCQVSGAMKLYLAIAINPEWSCYNRRTSLDRLTMMQNCKCFDCDFGSQRQNF